MILYYAPGACSLATHIALVEARIPHERVTVDRAKRTGDGRDFLTVSPKGFVPTLQLDDGAVLTENLAILTYIGEQGGALLPPSGILRWRALEVTSFMATEIHGGFRPFFYADATDAEKVRATQKVQKHFAALALDLGERAFLVGDAMTIADPYLVVMLRWAAMFGIEVPAVLGKYLARMQKRPSVAQALAEEGLS